MRRHRQDIMTALEKLIYDVIQGVEKLPAHERLTDAVILLGQAKDAVSDYVDQQLNDLKK